MTDPSDPNEFHHGMLESAREYQQRLQKELTRVSAFIADIEAKAAMPFMERKVRAGANPTDRDLGLAAHRILVNNGRPMKADALYAALEAEGIILRAKDPLKLMITKLWRSKDLVERIHGFGYRPATSHEAGKPSIPPRP